MKHTYHRNLKEANAAYRAWLEEHRALVAQAWEYLKESLPEAPFVLNPNTQRQVDNLVRNHDLSKFNNREFYGYRQWFHPVKGEQPSLRKYNRASRIHRQHNPHHVSYWNNHQYVHHRDHPYLVEMTLDWWALAIAQGRNPYEHYQEIRDSINLPREAEIMLDYMMLALEKTLRRRWIRVD